VLYEAGHLILTRPLKGCTALKSWAMRIAKRAGMKKAAVGSETPASAQMPIYL
jgi:transposase